MAKMREDFFNFFCCNADMIHAFWLLSLSIFGEEFLASENGIV